MNTLRQHNETESNTPKGALSKLINLLRKTPLVKEVRQPDTTELHVACVVHPASEDVKTAALKRVVQRQFTGNTVTIHRVAQAFLIVLFKKDPNKQN